MMSGQSYGSRGYLKKSADVDDTLFGIPLFLSFIPASRKLPPLTTSQRPEDLSKIMEEARRGQMTAPNAIMLSTNELARMRVSTPII